MNETFLTSPYVNYVLVAYGVTTLVVLGNMVATRARFGRVRRRLQAQLERRPTVGRKVITEKLS